MILANKKVYDENCVYQLKDKTLVVLDGFDGGSFKVSRIDAPENFWFELEIFECSVEVAYGKIGDAPVKLIDGEPYMFDYKRADRSRISENILAYYKKAGEYFAFNGESWATDRCVNIVRLVPEEK